MEKNFTSKKRKNTIMENNSNNNNIINNNINNNIITEELEQNTRYSKRVRNQNTFNNIDYKLKAQTISKNNPNQSNQYILSDQNKNKDKNKIKDNNFHNLDNIELKLRDASTIKSNESLNNQNNNKKQTSKYKSNKKKNKQRQNKQKQNNKINIDSEIAAESENTDNPNITNVQNNSKINNPHIDNSNKNSDNSANKQNRRVNIISQLEFYFSDENLIQDKFLKNRIQSDTESSIALKTLLLFPKLNLLLENIDNPIHYLQHTIANFSKVLQLSSNRLKVKRIIPFDFKNSKSIIKDIDERTVYIEKFPINNTSHDKIKEIFSEFGEVVNVSLPRFKSNRELKGFGFVSFRNQSVLAKVLDHFKYDNIYPKLLLEGNKGQMDALRVMSKAKWEESKTLHKEIVKELKRRCEEKTNNKDIVNKDNTSSNDLKADINNKMEKEIIVEISGVSANDVNDRFNIKNELKNITNRSGINKIIFYDDIVFNSISKENENIDTKRNKCFVYISNKEIRDYFISQVKERYRNYTVNEIAK